MGEYLILISRHCTPRLTRGQRNKKLNFKPSNYFNMSWLNSTPKLIVNQKISKVLRLCALRAGPDYLWQNRLPIWRFFSIPLELRSSAQNPADWHNRRSHGPRHPGRSAGLSWQHLCWFSYRNPAYRFCLPRDSSELVPSCVSTPSYFVSVFLVWGKFGIWPLDFQEHFLKIFSFLWPIFKVFERDGKNFARNC